MQPQLRIFTVFFVTAFAACDPEVRTYGSNGGQGGKSEVGGMGGVGGEASTSSSSSSSGMMAACDDGVRNGAETDVDCGGTCPPCAVGKVCIIATDCQSSNCAGSVCEDACPTQVGTCTSPCDGTACASSINGIQDNTESDIDCGGICALTSSQYGCPAGKKCTQNADCKFGVCIPAIGCGMAGTCM